MLAEPMLEVRCAVCGGGEHRVICAAREIGAHLEYLRRFHRRRLRASAGGGLREEELADRADFTHDYATDIVSCTACGLVFRSPRPTPAAIAQAYAQDHYGHARLASLFEAQSALYRPRARTLRRWLPSGPGSVVVEVGSFVGSFLAAGRAHGWEMLGVDPGEEVTDFCRERGLPVFRGTLAEAPVGRGTVDCIAVWNTFDQLPEPEPLLAAARALLRPGGILALRVPNGDCFRRLTEWLRQHPSDCWRLPRGWVHAAMAWNNLMAFPYLHGYSPRTLDWLLGWHGLERVAACLDTLPRLADDGTETWAACEEAALKLAWRLIARFERLLSPGSLRLAPWFDAYYRVGPSPQGRGSAEGLPRPFHEWQKEPASTDG